MGRSEVPSITYIEFAHMLLWMALPLITIGALFQVLENYKLRSTQGLSPSLIFLWFVGVLYGTAHVWLLNLPSAYKFWGSIQLIIVSILISQLLYYCPTSFLQNMYLTRFYVVLGSFVAFMGWAYINVSLAGEVSGWIMTVSLAISQVPQIIKIAKAHSVKGYSFSMILLFLLADCCELVAQIILQIPLAMKLRVIRCLIVDSVQLVQFIIYRKIKKE